MKTLLFNQLFEKQPAAGGSNSSDRLHNYGPGAIVGASLILTTTEANSRHQHYDAHITTRWQSCFQPTPLTTVGAAFITWGPATKGHAEVREERSLS